MKGDIRWFLTYTPGYRAWRSVGLPEGVGGSGVLIVALIRLLRILESSYAYKAIVADAAIGCSAASWLCFLVKTALARKI